MPYTRLPAAALAAFGLAVGAVAPAFAGSPSGLEVAQAQQFSDEKLQSFAMAALEVRQIRSDYVGRIQQAGSEEERQQLAQEANAEMVGAVEDTPGISVDDYNAIIEASADNPELSDRINQHMEAATQ